MDFKNKKVLVVISIIFGVIISISMGGYVNLYFIEGNLPKGTSYFLMFTSAVIIIESLALFVVCPILYLRLINKGINGGKSILAIFNDILLLK